MLITLEPYDGIFLSSFTYVCMPILSKLRHALQPFLMEEAEHQSGRLWSVNENADNY